MEMYKRNFLQKSKITETYRERDRQRKTEREVEGRERQREREEKEKGQYKKCQIFTYLFLGLYSLATRDMQIILVYLKEF